MIDGTDVGLFIQHHQTFLHMGCDLLEFIGFSLELLNLRINLPVLLIDPAQQWGKLLIGVVGQRLLQVQIV